MRALALLTLVVICKSEDVSRPVAIIPWSQYQMRMKATRSKPTHAPEQEQRHEYLVERNLNDIQTDIVARPPGGDEMPPRPSQRSTLPATPRPRSRPLVIRPQIRNRVIAEPSDYLREKEREMEKERAILRQEQLRTHRVYPPAPNVMPHKQPGIPMAPSPSMPSPARKISPLSVSLGQDLSGLEDIRIPKGVPFHAGTWEDGQPHYLPERKAVQHAASNVAGIDPNIPLAGLNEAIAQGQSSANQANIVNSIFSQSRAQGIPIQAVQNPQPNAVESFLANSGNLETISKLAKNLLNVGGGGGESGQSGGGLLDVMTNALGRLPLTSAHDDFPPTIEASRPQPFSLPNLINKAASAFQTSMRDKEKADRLERLQDKLQLNILEEKKDFEPDVKISKERENSLKLLEGLPKEQREILEAAIKSKEIDSEALGPAIGALVKEDTKEESKREKESRLLEWIRANRPNKVPEVKVSAEKLPYYGKYCGSLVEQGKSKLFHPSGAVWAVDERHIIVSKFFFQPVSLLSENVTFWLGPRDSTGNPLIDQFPDDNGYYVHPTTIDVTVFALEQLPPVPAKVRKNISAKVFLNGTQPIEPIKEKKEEQPLRIRRDVVHVNHDEQPPTYAPARKPVELLVKGGVVQVMANDHEEQHNSTWVVERPTSSEISDQGSNISSLTDRSSIITPVARVRQPEYDIIDYTIPQPLEWYAGFQPLLLTLPADKKINNLKWLALRDHKRQEIVASVLLPNGAAFVVPSKVTIRPLSSNGFFNISSGPIHIHDMKSIEITNFTLRTDGEPVWFMMGRDILPNRDGHIIPIYDTALGLFDCDSLSDYYGETIHLRIPGHMDMRDIFWFSVYSPSKSISFSHLYLPYDHLRLPPDLSGTPTVTCSYQA